MRVLEGISRAFHEWLSSMELSSGKLQANPTISFFSCIAAVSASSFSWKAIQPMLLLILSSSIFILCDTRNFRRSLKVSLLWFAFASLIMLPRALRDAGAMILPLRVASAVLTLSLFVELAGAKRLFRGLSRLISPLIGGDLGLALELMIIQIARYVRSLSVLILAKASRLIERKFLGDYSVISLAISDIFFRGPRDAFKASLVARSRLSFSLDNSLRDTLLIVALSLTYPLPLLV